MSSSSSDRYQSRLLNFIRNKSRFFSDLLGLRTRQLKVATSWSLEAMLYPIYKLWQTTVEFSGRQLPSRKSENNSHSSKVKNNPANPTPRSVDMAVFAVREFVEKIQLEKIQQKESEFVDSLIVNNAAKMSIRGIASLLCGSSSWEPGTDHLVLVTDENKILDILTPQQQQKLQGVIMTEIAKYNENLYLPQLKKLQPFLLRISRFFKKQTTAKSKNKILNGGATKTNILPTSIKQAINHYRETLRPNKTLFVADTTIARLECNTFVPVSQATLAFQKHSSQLVLSMGTKLSMFFNGKDKLPKKVQNSVPTDAEETNVFQFQNLIQAALNHFFGKGDGSEINQGEINQDEVKQLDMGNSYTSSLPGSISHKEVDNMAIIPPKNNESLNEKNLNQEHRSDSRETKENNSTCAKQSERWLELHDIFSESPKIQDSESVTSFLMPQTEIQESKNLFQKITSIFKGEEYSVPKRQYWIAKPKSLDAEEDVTQTELEVDPKPIRKSSSSAFTTPENRITSNTDTYTSPEETVKEETVNSFFDSPSGIVTTAGSENFGQIVHQPSKSSSTWEIEDDPDYFETESEVVGYEKHPLERILNCLDATLLKLEDLFARTVSLLQMLLRNLRNL